MGSYFKTALLFIVLTVLVVLFGKLVAGNGGMIIALFFAVIMNGASYFFSDKIALAMSNAQELQESDNPQLFQIVRELTQRANMPMPRVYLIPQAQPNAFATGRNPKHAAVAVTSGILQMLDANQLRGVLAHEISHVKNRDVLIATIAAVMAGVITYLAQTMAWFGMGGDREDRNPLVSIVMILFAPIGALLIQMAISRQREYAADHSGAELTMRPEDLASALETIEMGVHRYPSTNTNPAIAPLYIANPFGGLGGLTTLFSTHPSTADRVARLRGMATRR